MTSVKNWIKQHIESRDECGTITFTARIDKKLYSKIMRLSNQLGVSRNYLICRILDAGVTESIEAISEIDAESVDSEACAFPLNP